MGSGHFLPNKQNIPLFRDDVPHLDHIISRLYILNIPVCNYTQGVFCFIHNGWIFYIVYMFCYLQRNFLFCSQFLYGYVSFNSTPVTVMPVVYFALHSW